MRHTSPKNGGILTPHCTMHTNRRGPFVLAALLAAVVAATWLLFDHDGDIAPAPAGAESLSEPIRGGAAATPATTTNTPPPTTQRAAAAALANQFATLRGRCVDDSGTALAACRVTLTGRTGDRETVDAWLREHAAMPAWQDPPATTTAVDGRFEITFVPPPPFRFMLDFVHAGSADRRGFWPQIAAGAIVDLGDIVMSPGVLVAGRVVDDSGVPQANVNVELTRVPGQDLDHTAPVPARWGDQAATAADGAFALRARLTPGEYRVETRNAELASPMTVTLPAERSTEQLPVVVRRRALPSLRGRVLDEAGAPVAGLQIEDRAAQRGTPRTFSGNDGTFELIALAPDGPPNASLVPRSDEYENDASVAHEVPWGRTDVELRVRRAPGLSVRVTDTAGTPVETYVVRVLPRNTRGSSSNDSRVRAAGPHQDGIATVPGLARGDWLVLVEFPATSPFESLRVPFHHEAGPQRLDLRAAASARRTVRVLAMDEAPVAGATVQLCDPFDAPLDDSRMVMRRDLWMVNAGNNPALVVGEGVTDADGRIELRGPGDRELGLCVPGPGNVPLRQTGLRLGEPGEFVVYVRRGARLVGRIVPPEATAELKRLAGVEPTAAFPERYRPRLALFGTQGRFPKDMVAARDLASLRIADDGSFDAAGLPTGAWQFEVVHHAVHGSGARELTLACGEVHLFDGVPIVQDLDLSELLPGTLEGLVLWNGQPLANSNIGLLLPGRQEGVATNAEGRFRKVLRPGEYEVHVTRLLSPGNWANLPCPTAAHVVRGETTTQTFAVASASLRVTVLDTAGKPVPNLTLQARDENGRTRDLQPTDAQGTTTAELAPTVVTLGVPSKVRIDPGTAGLRRREAQARGEPDPFARQWITLHTVGLAAGQPNVIEVRLPPAAGY